MKQRMVLLRSMRKQTTFVVFLSGVWFSRERDLRHSQTLHPKQQASKNGKKAMHTKHKKSSFCLCLSLCRSLFSVLSLSLSLSFKVFKRVWKHTFEEEEELRFLQTRSLERLRIITNLLFKVFFIGNSPNLKRLLLKEY